MKHVHIDPLAQFGQRHIGPLLDRRTQEGITGPQCPAGTAGGGLGSTTTGIALAIPPFPSVDLWMGQTALQLGLGCLGPLPRLQYAFS
ncbi:MAG TPA: hypothetical protein VKK81_14155 [Candidatus Binatia bacterium]|nr:hypothetical protein [Candidatus Binatia bacterium]